MLKEFYFIYYTVLFKDLQGKNVPMSLLHFNCHFSNVIVLSDSQMNHILAISSSELLLSSNEKILRNAFKSSIAIFFQQAQLKQYSIY